MNTREAMGMANKFVDDLEKAQGIITNVINKLLILDAKRYGMLTFHLRQGQKYIGEVQNALSTEGDMKDAQED